MATFLELCRRVHRYARIGQDAPGTAPVTVADQKGVLAEIVGWVQDAWEDIQTDQVDWRFREASATIAAPSGDRTVDVTSLIDDYEQLRPFASEYRHRHILVAKSGAGASASQPVWFVEWEHWRGGRYEHGGGAEVSGMPGYFTIMPDSKLRLYPTPDAAIDLTLSYQRALQELAEDLDEPIMPPRHHTAIVWRALMYYADTRDKTQEPYRKWERRRLEAMRELYRDQLPEMSF